MRAFNHFNLYGKIIKIFFLAIALFFPEIAISDVYKCEISDGSIYYTDEPTITPDGSLHVTDTDDIKHTYTQPNFNCKIAVKTKIIVQTKTPIEEVCTETPITKSQISAVKKYISNKLNDPYSAHFKWSKNKSICKFMSITTITYCGFVNSKNKFGGYIGYIPFKVNLAESKNGWKVEVIASGEEATCADIEE